MKESFDEFFEMMKKNVKYCGNVKEQTVESYAKEIVEEADEVKEAVEKKDFENLKEELGDLLWDVFTMALIAERDGLFNAKEPLKSAIEKIKRRKPFLLEGRSVTKEESFKIFQKAKAEEKNGKR